jgi:hypothetical protein
MRCRPELAFVFLALVMAGCDPVEEDDDDAVQDTGSTSTREPIDEGPWSSLDERSCPPDSFVSFENFGGPFLLDHCKGCHSSALPADMRQDAPVGVDFDSLADVRQWAPRIWARAADQNATMPPVGAPGFEERTLLGEWLACGALLDADLEK